MTVLIDLHHVLNNRWCYDRPPFYNSHLKRSSHAFSFVFFFFFKAHGVRWSVCLFVFSCRLSSLTRNCQEFYGLEIVCKICQSMHVVLWIISELSWNHYHMATAMLQVYCVERIESRKIANYPWYLCYQSHFVASIHFFNVDMFFLSTFSQIFNQYKKPQTNSANMLFGY